MLILILHTHTKTDHSIPLLPFNSIVPLSLRFSTQESRVQGRRRSNVPREIRRTASNGPLHSSTELCFINSAFYPLYCSATAVLFIIACDGCSEPRDKRARRSAFLKLLWPEVGGGCCGWDTMITCQ